MNYYRIQFATRWHGRVDVFIGKGFIDNAAPKERERLYAAIVLAALDFYKNGVGFVWRDLHLTGMEPWHKAIPWDNRSRNAMHFVPASPSRL